MLRSSSLCLCRPLLSLSFNYTDQSGEFTPGGLSALLSPCFILLSFPAEAQSDGNFTSSLWDNESQCPQWRFVDSVCVCVLSPDEVTMEEVGQAAQLRAGELIIIVVVLIMWAGNIPLQQRTFITADIIGIRCLWAK